MQKLRCGAAVAGLMAVGVMGLMGAGRVQPAEGGAGEQPEGAAPAAAVGEAGGEAGTVPILFGKAEPNDKRPGTLRLATYNVENLFDDRDDLSLSGMDDDLGSIKPVGQLEALAETIRRLDADVLALQEVESYDAVVQFNETYLRAMGYEYIVSLEAGSQRGIENAVLSRFPLTTGQVWPNATIGGLHPPKMDHGGDNWWAGQPIRFWRSPLRVDVEVKPPTAERGPIVMTLFVVHHRNPTLMKYWRDAEARAVVGLIEDVRTVDPDRRVALVGDFNAGPDSTPMEVYTGAGLTDTLADRTPGSPEFVTQATGRTINFIMLDEGLRAKVVEGSAGVLGTPVLPPGVDRNQYLPPEGYASDHFPVYVDLDLTEPAAEAEPAVEAEPAAAAPAAE